jgi:Fic family protein
MINSKGEQVTLFAPTPPHLVEAEMRTVIEWTNEQLERGEIHPLLIVANCIFELLAVHPFEDGNGRISRALTNLLLLRAGYSYIPYVSLDEIIEKTKADYYLALRATQKNHKTDAEDIASWVDYFLTVLMEQANRAQKIMDEDQPEKLLSEKQQEVYRLFGEGKEMGVAEVSALLKGAMERETVKQVLYRLVKLRLLERVGQGRGARYVRI